MYIIYEDQPAQSAMVRVGQSTDTDYKRAIIKASSRYRFNHHSFLIDFYGDNRVKFIDNGIDSEF